MPFQFPRLLLALTLLCGLFVPFVHATERPKVGLVLGGGGARGAAHIGVLEELERLRIPVDCVAGTSMGALIAGAWASGLDPAAMRIAMRKADWSDMFQDNPDNTDVSLRTKRLAERYLAGSETGISPNGITTPPGVVSGQKIKLFFNQLVHAEAGERQIDKLALPVAIIATDIASGERVVFRDGSLTQAMRASMSVPGLMAPLVYQGRKLVDGGLVDNLPIQAVRDLCGAQVVIAVNVGSPLLKAREVTGLLSVSAQMVSLLTEQNVTRSIAELGERDIYIKPDLDGLSAADFDRSGDAADRGRAAAQASAALQGLAVDAPTYAAWQQRWQSVTEAETTVDAIEIVGAKSVNPAAVSRYLTQQVGAPLDVANLNRDLLRVYGEGYFEGVDYGVSQEGGRRLLRVMPLEKSWGPNYLRMGLNLNSSWKGLSSYSLRAAYHQTLLNALGGESLTWAELGSRTGFGAEYYQPLDPARSYFFEARGSLRREEYALFGDDLRISDFRNAVARLELAVGKNFALLGQAQIGWREERHRFRIETGLPLLPTNAQKVSGVQASVELDQRNQRHFASRGWSTKATWFESANRYYNLVSLGADGAFQMGDWVLGLRGRYAGSTHGVLPGQEVIKLGGFLKLSGFASEQLSGDKVSYAHVRGEHILGRMPLGLRGDMRVGVALEAGRIRKPLSEPNLTGRLDSVALYLGGDTPVGPVYVGLGRSSKGQTNVYFFIGTP